MRIKVIFLISALSITLSGCKEELPRLNDSELRSMVVRKDIYRIEVMNKRAHIYLIEDINQGPQFQHDIQDQNEFADSLESWYYQFGLDYDYLTREEWLERE